MNSTLIAGIDRAVRPQATLAIKGVAEWPRVVRPTAEDIKIARAERPIPTPRTEAEVKDFLVRLYHSDLFKNVNAKLAAFKLHSPDQNMAHWSTAQFLGYRGATEAGRASPYFHDVYRALGWPDSRRNIHQNSINTLLNPAAQARPGQDKNFIAVIGPPGAGKSTIGVPYVQQMITPQVTTVNADHVRESLPEYDGWNPTPVHQEVSYLTHGPLMHTAFKQNHHILYHTMGHDTQVVEEAMVQARSRGYKTHLILVHRPTHKIMGAVWERFRANAYGANHPDRAPSRYTNPVWARTIKNAPKKTFDHIKQGSLVNSFTHLTPSDIPQEQPIIVEHGHD